MRGMDRVVTEYSIAPDGRLRPIRPATWRIEPALGEAGLHRTLAALPRTPEAVARAASTYGPLRRRSSLVAALPPSAWGEMAVVLGQSAVPEWATAIDWLDRGAVGRPPGVLVEWLPALRALAALPPAVRDYMSLVLRGGSRVELRAAAAIAEAEIGEWDANAATSAMTNAIDAAAEAQLAGGASAIEEWPSAADPSLLWAVRFVEEVQAALAGYAELPAGIDAGVITSSSLASLPDLLRPLEDGRPDAEPLASLVAALRTETLGDWSAVADEMTSWVTAIDIRKRADTGRLMSDDGARLLSLVDALLDGIADGLDAAASAGEIAPLVLPRLTARLRTALQSVGAWPYPADRPVGTYARALWAVLQELTDSRPPQRCAVASCLELFPAHGNRRYCDSHRLSRDRERKRTDSLRRSRPSGAGRA